MVVALGTINRSAFKMCFEVVNIMYIEAHSDSRQFRCIMSVFGAFGTKGNVRCLVMIWLQRQVSVSVHDVRACVRALLGSVLCV